jgi:hypothetical protein
MSIVSPSGGGASDESRKAVSGWREIMSGKKETRRERIIREQRDNKGNNSSNSEFVSKDAKRQALIDAQKYAEEQPENPTRHLKEAYKNKRMEEVSKKKIKLNSQKTLALLVDITERGGKIFGVSEAGFGIFLIEYAI